MDNYTKLVTDLIKQEIEEYKTWNEGTTTKDALEHMRDNGFENLFGNIDGSRTCSTYEAQQFIDKSGAVWDDDVRDLFTDIELEWRRSNGTNSRNGCDVRISKRNHSICNK